MQSQLCVFVSVLTLLCSVVHAAFRAPTPTPHTNITHHKHIQQALEGWPAVQCANAPSTACGGNWSAGAKQQQQQQQQGWCWCAVEVRP